MARSSRAVSNGRRMAAFSASDASLQPDQFSRRPRVYVDCTVLMTGTATLSCKVIASGAQIEIMNIFTARSASWTARLGSSTLRWAARSITDARHSNTLTRLAMAPPSLSEGSPQIAHTAISSCVVPRSTICSMAILGLASPGRFRPPMLIATSSWSTSITNAYDVPRREAEPPSKKGASMSYVRPVVGGRRQPRGRQQERACVMAASVRAGSRASSTGHSKVPERRFTRRTVPTSVSERFTCFTVAAASSMASMTFSVMSSAVPATALAPKATCRSID